MSLASKADIHWSTPASLSNLRKRANLIQQIRHFFEERQVLEVETPLLSSTTTSDPHIQSMKIQQYYLQTSPEFAMKRLLPSGIGPIFQICKAFRDDEIGRLHNPEFTMLEWYRPGFDHHRLMDEVNDLLSLLLNTPRAIRKTYQQTFRDALNIDPLTATTDDLKHLSSQHHLDYLDIHDKDTWLDLLFSHCIQPKLGFSQPYFIYDFPASQAALSKIRQDNPPVAERFEIIINGMEIGNGYHELTNPLEQEQRFIEDNMKRIALGHPTVPVDQRLIAALDNGFPESAGVAIGVDRIVLLACKATSLSEIMCFTLSDMR